MNTEYFKWWSGHLHQDMELKIYGHSGKPVLVFPTSGGRFYEYEDFGMIEACRPFIDAGKIQIFAVDSIDQQSWLNTAAHPAERARRHNQFDRYIVEELAPAIRFYTGTNQKFLSTGCSLGAYHAVNFLFRHPDIFDSVIALSGLYSLRFSSGTYSDDNIYYNSPLDYLPQLHDPWFLDQYRASEIIICAGQGAWEEEVLRDTYALGHILACKDIPAWIDIWGHDVKHDWPWWRLQMPHFLDKLFYR